MFTNVITRGQAGTWSAKCCFSRPANIIAFPTQRTSYWCIYSCSWSSVQVSVSSADAAVPRPSEAGTCRTAMRNWVYLWIPHIIRQRTGSSPVFYVTRQRTSRPWSLWRGWYGAWLSKVWRRWQQRTCKTDMSDVVRHIVRVKPAACLVYCVKLTQRLLVLLCHHRRQLTIHTTYTTHCN